MNTASNFEGLLDEVRREYLEALKHASLSDVAARLTPVADVGAVIRRERKKQGQTLQDLSDLSGVTYTTLSRIENGHPSVRLDSLRGVLGALGLTLWVA